MKHFSALERKFDICYNMDKHWRHYGTWNKPVTKGQKLYDSNSSNQIHIDRKWNGNLGWGGRNAD